jgi:hypothetical protein
VSDDLSKKFCANPKCNGIMKELINVVNIPWTRTGWLCETCMAFNVAEGQQTVVNSYHQIKGRA